MNDKNNKDFYEKAMNELNDEFPETTKYEQSYKQALNDLDNEFPGATYDDNLNNYIFEKENSFLKFILSFFFLIQLH